ncbi:MAG: hypothetical protein CMO78_05310 [Verrucomicrobiales bacterium]|nr:hypothetical protein [Verrucomicrobiales bacterium]
MPAPSPNPPAHQYKIVGADGNPYGPVDLNGLLIWISQGQPAMAFPELAGRFGSATPHIAQQPIDPKKEATAKKLVIASHILGYGGLVILIGGPIAAGVLFESGTMAGIAAVIGIVMAVIGALVGQVGRGMQGRAI